MVAADSWWVLRPVFLRLRAPLRLGPEAVPSSIAALSSAMEETLITNLLRSQGNYDEAKPLYEKALAIRLKVLGEMHPMVAQSYNNLAMLYWNQDPDSVQAAEMGKKALAIAEKTLGAEHPDTKDYRRDWG